MDYSNRNYGGIANTTAAVNAYSGPSEPESGSPIRDCVGAAEQSLSELHNVIDGLEKRLDTVLTPMPPTGAGTNATQPQPVTSHVRGRLIILNDGYQHATQRLHDLIRRVEI